VRPEGTDRSRRESRAVRQRRERLYARWDEHGGPSPLYRWWIASPWRWLLAGGLVMGFVGGFHALTGLEFSHRLWLVVPMTISGLAVASGLYDEWSSTRHPDGSEPRTLPYTARRLVVGAQVVLVASLLGLVVLTTNATPAPDERAIAEALFGADTHHALLAADEPASDPTELSVLELGEWSWVVATRGEGGECRVYRFEDGEVVQRGQARDPEGGCTADVAAAQLEDSSA
jgi:hypothetical protein